MKHYLELVPLSAKAHRRQHRMTLACIAMAVFLVTAIFSMADMAVRMEQDRVLQKHGHWHILLSGISTQQAALVAQRSDVYTAAWYNTVNAGLSQDYHIGSQPFFLCGADETFLADVMVGYTIREGRFPQTEQEVLLSTNAKALLGVELGSAVVLDTPFGSTAFTVVGFGADTAFSYAEDAPGVFVTSAAFQQLVPQESADPPAYFVRFRDGVNVRRTIPALKQQYGLEETRLSENGALMGLMGFSTSSYITGMYGIAAVLFVLVLAAGVLMIAGSLNSKVAERTQFYGMLRCIGASKAQVARLVRLEALYWCRVAVPGGLALGVLSSWLLCALLRLAVSDEFGRIPLFALSWVGLVCGAVTGLLTVLLSAHAPARHAARVSPVAAVNGSAQGQRAVRHAAHTRILPVEAALGVHHAVSAKKNLLLMTGSFALSIVLFLCFSALLVWVRQAMSPLRPYAPDLTVYSRDGSALEPALVDTLQGEPDVQRAFGRMYQSLPAQYQGQTGSIDLISYEAHQFGWAESSLASGSIAPVQNGGQDGACYVLTVFDKSNTLAVGDTIQLDGAELTVAGVLQDSPFDTTDTPTVICSEETFVRLTGKSGYALVDVQLHRSAGAEEAAALRTLLGQSYKVTDLTANNREAVNTYWLFTLVVYGFLAILTAITVLNIINSISMSVSARIRQYGAMQAVGMTGRQLACMVAAETLTYALLGLVVGCALGLPLYRLFYTVMITAYWGTAFRFPAAALALITAVMALACAAAVYAPVKRLAAAPVTETIRAL